ncbi:hypothetical protein ACJJTC_018580 [Scirpophaga incertulas]
MNEVSGRRTAGSRSLAARCAGNTRLPQKACFIYLPKQVSGKNPQTYIDIMGSNATIRRLVTERTGKPKKSEESQTSEEEEDTECLYCCGLYSESTEEWITCHTCGKWAHCGCAGVDDSDDEAEHICTVCEDDGA